MNQEEEFLLLLTIVVLIDWKQASNSHSLVRYRAPYLISSGNFDLNNFDEEYVRRLTRFSKHEIRTLSKYFQLNQIQ